MKPVIFLLLLVHTQFNLLAGDTLSGNRQQSKRFIFVEGGLSSNFASIKKINSASQPNYEFSHLSAYSFGIGYTQLFKNWLGSLSLRRVTIGDAIVMKSFPTLVDFPPVFIEGTKGNFLLGLSGGYRFKIKRLCLDPHIGMAMSINPKLNTRSDAYVAGGNDTIYMSHQMRLTSGNLMFVKVGLSLSHPIHVGGFDFSVGLTCDYVRGLMPGYTSITDFRYKTHAYNFEVENRGTHLIYALQFIFPLEED